MCVETTDTTLQKQSGSVMGRRNKSSDRRGTNVAPSRTYVIKTTYNKPSHPRLHVRPSPRTPAADRVLRRPPPSIRQPLSDNRFWHPLGWQKPVVSYSGTQSHRKRLLDTPRPAPGHVLKWKQSKSRPLTRAQSRKLIYQYNRFGPQLDRQTKAIVAFHDPTVIPHCDKRKTRKQVLHARGIAGGRVKKPKFNENSRISCHGV